MPGATTPTIDLPPGLPLREHLPPPLPPAAPRPRRRATTTQTTTIAPGARIGAWRVEREIGRGGMATVFAVAHTRFGKRAALKLAHPAILGPQFTPETFLREARIANLIDHVGVPDVFATGTYAGRPYLAMERLHGRSLGDVVQAGALPRDAALDILIELCDVLEAAHAVGVTHGDLKADNVFVLDQPGIGGRRTKLLDWGIARITGEDDPLRGLLAGTLIYVAPEQIRGDDITPAADVYALGVLAYRLLLGAPPFASSSDLDLLHKHLRDAPPAPRALWPAIPAALETTLLAMLAKQPAGRPPLREVMATLRAVRARARPGKHGWRSPGAPLPADVIGRPMLANLPGRPQQVAGAALGVALAIACLLRLFSA